MREENHTGGNDASAQAFDRTVTASPDGASGDVASTAVETGRTVLAQPRPRAGGSGSGPGTGPYQALVTVDAGHYAMGDEITRGGMGRISIATDRRLDRKVAIKEVLRSTGELALRFEREARITAKLQHPSIVAVHEAGQWTSGTPFYAMPFIEGRTLDEVLREAKTLEARLALLPHVLAVADAMAYAHRHGIIHRDLKPKNVMVGPFGETIVIDWGLAKELGEDEVVLAAGSAPDRLASSAATELGTILGTPAYMSPEQARGPDVDARADAYALGAILYEVLSGRPPYLGTSPEDVIAKLLREPPPPLRTLVPAVPLDLAAIVAKAMARDLADRYPSARELAEDLRRFQTGLLVTARQHSAGERLLRWARRHRAFLASAAIVLVVTAAVTALAFVRVVRERDAAQQQRNRALAERGAAEGLVDFVLVDLRAQLAKLGQLEPMFGVGAEVERYYGKLQPWRDDRDPDALRRRAQALEVLGDVQDARGEHALAVETYRASLELRRRLGGDLDIARMLTRIGQTLIDVRDDDAVVAFDEARRLLEPLLVGAIDARTATVMAETVSMSGDVWLKRDDLTRAEAEYRLAIAVLARVPRPRDDAELRTTLAKAHERLGVVLSERGDHAGALASYQVQLGLSEALAKEDPVPRRRALEEIAHSKVGRALQALDRVDDAQVHYARAMALARQLVTLDPSNIDWWHALASSASDFGTIRLVRKDLASAQAAFTEAHEAIVKVAAADPKQQRWQRHVAVALSKLGQVKQERGDLPGALADFQQTVAILEKSVAADPQSAVARQQLAIGHSYVGDLEVILKHPDAALAAYQALADTVTPAAGAAGPEGVAFTKILAVGLGLSAAVYAGPKQDPAAADAKLAEAIRILEGLRAGERLDGEGKAYLAEFGRQRAKLAKK